MDKYDEDIAAIHDEAATNTWQSTIHKHWVRATPLFQFCTRDGLTDIGLNGEMCGCLTEVRLGVHPACTKELTAAIREDDRLPTDWADVTPEHLPVFAEWQRRLDKEIRQPQSVS